MGVGIRVVASFKEILKGTFVYEWAPKLVNEWAKGFFDGAPHSKMWDWCSTLG